MFQTIFSVQRFESLEIEEPELSQAQITEYTRSLRQTFIFFFGIIGLWAIWNEVLPACMSSKTFAWGVTVSRRPKC